MQSLLSKSFRGAVIAIGDELVTGQTVDSNSAWLSRRLNELGVVVQRHVTVADDAAATTEAIAACGSDAGWVIVTGGLGPTPDDLTRQGVAQLLGESLELRADALAGIEERFRRMGRTMAPANRVQAMAPPSARMIANPVGTAPGLEFTFAEARCFCLPGVPGEMRLMFNQGVAPQVRASVGDGAALLARTVHTFGIGESDLAQRLAGLLDRGRNPQLGTTAAGGSVSVRIYARADSPQAAERILDQAEAQVTGALGSLCFGRDEQTLESVVGGLLRSAHATVAVAESCTGGLVAQMITSVPGSSAYFLQGVVPYAYQAKESLLGVDHATLVAQGAVSEDVARQMAENLRHRSGADWTLSLTGIAGPAGATESKPVGLIYIALAGPGGVNVHRFVFPGDRDIVRERAARTALNLLRLALLDSRGGAGA